MKKIINMLGIRLALRWAFYAVTMAGTMLLAGTSYGASATAKSDSWWYSQTATVSDTYTPATGVGANMIWTGEVDADQLSYSGTKTEKKFTQPLPLLPVGTTSGANFTGYKLSAGPGDWGSTALSTGTGNSTITKGAVWDGYSATWTVTATGVLGKRTDGLPGTKPYKYAYMNGTDPWPITAADLASIGGTQYSLYIPFEITGGSSIGSGANFNSAFGFDVDYTTASGTTPLLQINISGSQVTVTGDTAANFILYTINDLTASPNFTTPITLAQFQGDLAADLSGNALVSPVDLGLSLTDIPIPTADLGDGSVASISEDAWASDEAVPETSSTFTLLGLGTLSLLACDWRLRMAKA
jgi:hypothetical protein